MDNSKDNDHRVSRGEHLQWCKDRALEYVKVGDCQQAFASMAADLGEHDETAGHSGIELGMGLLMIGSLNEPHEMRKFIEGFN
jgi:hypothetical protein